MTTDLHVIQSDDSGNFYHGIGDCEEIAEREWEPRFAENAEELGLTIEELKDDFINTFNNYTHDEFLKFCVEYGEPQNCTITITK